jgi:hypothetical protein
VVFGIEIGAGILFRGFGMHNPYFNNLPLDGTKESYLLLRRS